MYRRVAAAAGAAALLVVALPALPANAAAAGTATLAADGVEVLPGANGYEIAVANTESTGFLGMNGGRTVNTVRVILPAEVGVKTTATPPSVPGWTVTRSSTSGLEQYLYRASGAGIAPAGTFTFPVPATVAAPSTGDRSGAFQVGLSSDGGNTFQAATGALATTIKTLQITALSVVNRPGQVVSDGTGTAKQTIDAAVTVKNFATGPQTITATLAGTGSGDTITPAAAAAVAGLATRTFTVPVQLAAVTADTSRTYTASATSPKSSTGTGAEFARTLPYTIQAAPTFNLVSATFAPTAVRRGLSYAFSVSANKVGTPTLSVPDGSLTLKNRADGTSTPAISLGAPVSFVSGAESKTFTFTESTVGAAVDGRYDALFGFVGTDGNGAPLDSAQLAKSLLDVLSIDNLGPLVSTVVSLPRDADNDPTTAARDYSGNNPITVSGTVDDVNARAATVVLECVVSGAKLTPVSAPTTTVSGSTLNYTASFQPTFGNCGAFRAYASFQDQAGNVGERYSPNLIEVDNTIPTLTGVLGSVGRYNGVDAAKSSVMVNIDDNTATTADGRTGVIGGCDPRAYAVDGQLLVQAVYVKEEGAFRDCTVGLANMRATAKPDNNERYLRLTSDITRGGANPEPTVTYDPARSSSVSPDRLKDAAGNYAALGIQDTVNRLVPLAPVLVEVLRNAGNETAYFADGAYWTRFSGTDLTVTASGALTGDVLQLVRADGSEITRQSTTDGEATVRVPVAASQRTVQDFSVRFVSSAGVLGDLTPLKVIFDSIKPASAGSTKSGSTAVATFSEAVIGGNEAVNWNVFENVQDEDGSTIRAFRGVNSVSGAGATRTISANFTSNPYGGALYDLLQPKGYEDYAGNLLNTTTEFLAS